MPKDSRKDYLSQEVAEQLIVTARESKQLANGENNTLIRLVEELKKVLKQRPNDLPGHILLVKNSARLKDFITARIAQEKVLILLGERANSFSYSNYAELCIKAASGYLSLEAAMAIKKALSIDPDNPQAKFYSSLQFLQENKSSNTFRIWIELLDKEPIDSRWVTLVVAQIATISSSFNLEKEMVKKPNLELSNSLSPLLKLLDSLELRLNRKSGSIKDWIVLIEGYQQINIESKVNQNIEKVKSLFSLTESQIIRLESYKR
jgi:cytochrome c-type biogenesis protein CcmH